MKTHFFQRQEETFKYYLEEFQESKRLFYITFKIKYMGNLKQNLQYM